MQRYVRNQCDLSEHVSEWSHPVSSAEEGGLWRHESGFQFLISSFCPLSVFWFLHHVSLFGKPNPAEGREIMWLGQICVSQVRLQKLQSHGPYFTVFVKL